jgi:transcriptional regulator with XRE-family HTH domain
VTGRRGGPTVRRRRLGAELRRYRETAGLTIDVVAEKMDCSASKISRLETGQTGASPRDVRDMLVLYNVGQPELDDLMDVARETRQRGWWRPYGSILTGAYVAFEAAAASIRSYESQCVPSLLQTDEYARCQVAAARPDLPPEEIASRVRVRLDRQALLTSDDPLHFWCVLDEAALMRPVGGPDVMRAQLEHLVASTELSHVKLQVLPFDVGAHAGMDGSFLLLHFPDEQDPDTVYVVMATGGVFQEKADELRRYETVFSSLHEVALPPDESVAFLARKAKESF